MSVLVMTQRSVPTIQLTSRMRSKKYRMVILRLIAGSRPRWTGWTFVSLRAAADMIFSAISRCSFTVSVVRSDKIIKWDIGWYTDANTRCLEGQIESPEVPYKKSDKLTSIYIRDRKEPKRSGVTAIFKMANAIALTLPSTRTSSGLW